MRRGSSNLELEELVLGDGSTRSSWCSSVSARRPAWRGGARADGLPRSRSGDAGDGICGNRGAAGGSLGRRI